jgi:type III restriction enzyme
VAELHQQVLQLGGQGDWTEAGLVAWLDGHIFVDAADRHEITAGESAEFLRKVVRGLMAKFDIADVSALALDRFRLRDEIEARIREHRDAERKTASGLWLALGSALTVSEERAINFHEKGYEPGELYDGSFQFAKHYFGKPGELREKKAEGKITEEVRNLARKSSSFRLQTSKDWFYPDFICQLVDGRVLAVEYKGQHLFDGNDAGEKRAVGEVWAQRSGGRCLFAMPTTGEFSTITPKICGK